MEDIRNESQNYAKLHRKEQTLVKSEKESDTEVIIASLKKLQLKLQQLEDERNIASKLIDRLHRSGEHLLNMHSQAQPKSHIDLNKSNISIEELNCIKNYCDEVEINLIKIVVASKEPLVGCALKKEDSAPVKKEQILKKEAIERRTERKHYKPDFRYPFVPTGPGRTYSLPGTIQTLLSNMKSQHNHLCYITDVGDSVMDVISSSENYLKQLSSAMLDSAQYLKTECLRFSKQTNNDLSATSPLAVSLSHLDAISQLIERILDLQNKIVILKKRIKNASNLGSNIPAAASNKITIKIDDQKSTNYRHRSEMKSEEIVKIVNQRPKHSNPTRKPNVHPFHQRSARQLKKPVPKTRDTSNLKVVHSNADTLRYVKLLQTSLRKNGYRLKMIED